MSDRSPDKAFSPNQGIQADSFLRRAIPDDFASIRELLAQARLPLAGVREHLDHFMVLLHDGELVAIGGLEVYDDKGLLRSVAVAQAHQNKGHGRRISDAMINLAVSEGISELFLLTETGEGFFRKIGFESISRDMVSESVKSSVEFRVACPESAVCMNLQM